MQCRYCRAWNEEDERRCLRCGRRMSAARPSFQGQEMMPLSTATAPALDVVREPEPIQMPRAAAQEMPRAAAQEMPRAAAAAAGASWPAPAAQPNSGYQPSL